MCEGVNTEFHILFVLHSSFRPQANQHVWHAQDLFCHIADPFALKALPALVLY